MLPMVGFLARCQCSQWTADETETQQRLAPSLNQFPFVCPWSYGGDSVLSPMLHHARWASAWGKSQIPAL